MRQTLSVLSLTLTAPLSGSFYPYFTDEEIEATERENVGHVRSGGLRMQISGLFLLCHPAGGRLGARSTGYGAADG